MPISVNCRPHSHQSILCILHFSPFLTKCILLAMCLVCLIYLPLLAIHIEDLLSNTFKGDSSGTMSVYLFKNSWINMERWFNFTDWDYYPLKTGDKGKYPVLHVKQVKCRALAYKTYLAGSVTQSVTNFCDLALRSHGFSLHVITVRTYRPVGA